MINQSISFITLGVQNLDRMKKFYTEVFRWEALKDEEGIVFFQMNGFILGLFPYDELAADAKVSAEGSGFKRFTLALNVDSEAKVKSVMDELKSRGVKVVCEAEPVFWGGYRGYVADPEDNYWEICYNPFVKLAEDGSVIS